MGLFEFVFGKGAPKDENAPKQAYYLNTDDAKTFGNIDYMRSSKTVKRTFAKKKGQTEHLESIRTISAMSAAEVAANNASNGYSQQPSVTFSSAASSAPAPTASASVSSDSALSGEKSAPAPAPAPRRKPSSNDMDMFRNMAKDIRK